MRCYISSYKNNHKISPKIKQIINLENKIGLFSNKNLLNFKYKINNHRKKLKNFLKKLKKTIFRLMEPQVKDKLSFSILTWTIRLSM